MKGTDETSLVEWKRAVYRKYSNFYGHEVGVKHYEEYTKLANGLRGPAKHIHIEQKDGRRPWWTLYTAAERVQLYQILLPAIYEYTGCVRHPHRKRVMLDGMNWTLVGISEKLFMDVYYDVLKDNAVVPYNDHYQVDHFHKMKANDIWTLSGVPEDGVAVHFADDLFRMECKGKVSTKSVMMLMGVFERLHTHAPKKVKHLQDMDYGTVQLYGSRPLLSRFRK